MMRDLRGLNPFPFQSLSVFTVNPVLSLLSILKSRWLCMTLKSRTCMSMSQMESSHTIQVAYLAGQTQRIPSLRKTTYSALKRTQKS